MRFYLALTFGKITKLLIKLFHPGAGFTWPGHVALSIDPNFLASSKIKFDKGLIVISGTNGKTTTSKLITHLAYSQGLVVTHNKTGGNILNGVASTILVDMNWFGNLNSDLGVFEVDEFTLPLLLKYFDPNYLLLLNLSRDQLDRYGEIDIIVDKWLEALSTNNTASLFVQHNHTHLNKISNNYKGFVLEFSDENDYLAYTKLHGRFNAQNVNAAVLACLNIGLKLPEILTDLSKFDAAYGRGEIIEYKGKFFQVFLAKNPASFNHNLEMLQEQRKLLDPRVNPDTLLFILNDEVRDGRDVSWIYDINRFQLADVCKGRNIYVTGLRNNDMAVRLKYAGVNILTQNVHATQKKAVEAILSNSNCSQVVVLPNYSAMLLFRKLLLGKEIL